MFCFLLLYIHTHAISFLFCEVRYLTRRLSLCHLLYVISYLRYCSLGKATSNTPSDSPRDSNICVRNHFNRA